MEFESSEVLDLNLRVLNFNVGLFISFFGLYRFCF